MDPAPRPEMYTFINKFFNQSPIFGPRLRDPPLRPPGQTRVRGFGAPTRRTQVYEQLSMPKSVACHIFRAQAISCREWHGGACSSVRACAADTALPARRLIKNFGTSAVSPRVALFMQREHAVLPARRLIKNFSTPRSEPARGSPHEKGARCGAGSPAHQEL